MRTVSAMKQVLALILILAPIPIIVAAQELHVMTATDASLAYALALVINFLTIVCLLGDARKKNPHLPSQTTNQKEGEHRRGRSREVNYHDLALIMREALTEEACCPKCGCMTTLDAKVCPACGAALVLPPFR